MEVEDANGNDTHSDSDEDSQLLNEDEYCLAVLKKVKSNKPKMRELDLAVLDRNTIDVVLPDESDWTELGRDIANNTHLEEIYIGGSEITDHEVTSLFQGLTRSTSIERMFLGGNPLSTAVIEYNMMSFLQNANKLAWLKIGDSCIKSDGFNKLLRALRDSPIRGLDCGDCGIESIEIDIDHFPKMLSSLLLSSNQINANGCQELAKLLRLKNSVLRVLSLADNKIDDAGAEVLVNALHNNTTLEVLTIGNDEISVQGHQMLWKLVNDISSIGATLRSNHTLQELYILPFGHPIQIQIRNALRINSKNKNNPEAAGREKVIQTQLHSVIRQRLSKLQGVTSSLYSEINPLHLPEVLALVGGRHGQGELHTTLCTTISTLLSTVNRPKCIEQQMDYHATITAEHKGKFQELTEELDMLSSGGSRLSNGIELRSSKRRKR